MFNPFKLNYDKPGKGVRENEPQKKGIFRFFEIIGLNLKGIVVLNFLFILTSIPIVTIGPSFAAMSSVMYDYLGGNYSMKASEYFAAFKKHFKRGLFTGIAALLFGFGIFYNLIYFVFFSQSLVGTYLGWLFVVLAILYVIVHSYVYTLLVSTNESVLELYTDAFILTLAKLPVNLAFFVGLLIYPIIIGWIHFASFIPVFISTPVASTLIFISLFSVCQLAAVMYTRSVIKKLI